MPVRGFNRGDGPSGGNFVTMAEGKPVKSRIGLVVLLGVVVIVGGAMAVLATWTIPAPSTTVEKVIPNEKFSR
jgi:hypothetical protein